MTEAQLERSFCKELTTKYGAICIKNRAGVGVPEGFPDRTITLPYGITIYIEFKASEKAQFRPLQEAQIARLRGLDAIVYVCYPENRDKIWAQITEIL